jgi:OPT family oligopeptide transporter
MAEYKIGGAEQLHPARSNAALLEVDGVPGKQLEEGISQTEFEDMKKQGEDFMDPKHPLYGEVDEHGRKIPAWHEQITIRAIIVAAGIGFIFNLMVMKLGFTVGIIPSLNIAAGLIGFTATKLYVYLMSLTGLTVKPFTRQENTVIQTCVVACYGLAFSGGFTNFLVAMDWPSYLQSLDGASYFNGTIPDDAYTQPPNPLPANVLQPSLGKSMGFMAIISFIGIFALVPMRKLFVVKYRLTYPSGTATGTIINGFHTPLGAATAKRQVKALGKWFGISFCYSGLKWCFSGTGDSCGLDNIPSLGRKAQFWTWYSAFSATYIGIGMLVPKHITFAIMLGAIMSYGIMWPLINEKAGEWYPAKYGQGRNDIRGLYAYKVFVALGLILGDGAYNIFKLTYEVVTDLYKRHKARSVLPTDSIAQLQDEELTEEQLYVKKLTALRDFVFMKDSINWKIAIGGYVALAAICIGVCPQLFPGVKAYYVLVAYLIAPMLAFCNAYGMGLSDWSLLTTYGKLAILIFAAWGSGGNSAIIGGLAMCGVMQVIVGSAADLMQDFKTGFLTLSNPRSMFAAQLIGAFLAVFISPATFWIYWTGFPVGDPNSQYPAPFAPVFRNLAAVAVEGSSALPQHCLAMFGGFFGLALVLDILREYLGHRFGPQSIWVKSVPIPSMLGIPAFIGAYFCVDMTIGAVILGIWQYFDPAECLLMAPVVASALVAGDGVWSVPSAILALAKVSPPICAQFFKTGYYDENVGALFDAQPL